MDFWQVISERKSYRNFTSQPVEQEKILKILEAARLAPSWQNRQCWRFVVVQEKNKIKKIGALNPFTLNINFFLQKVPVIIVACANPKDSGHRHGIDYYIVDISIAMEHIVLAATDLGLATCWVGSFDEKMIKDVLEIPDEIRVVAMTPLGYAAEKENIVDKVSKFVAKGAKRKPLEDITYFDKWKNSATDKK
jgi:nitroreductase